MQETGSEQTVRMRLEGVGFPLGGGLRVADVGSGTGVHTRYLRGVGHMVLPVDTIRPLVEGGVQLDAYELGQRYPGAFDAVLCVGVLQHTPDPPAFLESLYAALKPGGSLHGDVYPKSPWAWNRQAWRIVTTRVSTARLEAFLAWYVPWRLRWDAAVPRGWLRWLLPFHPIPGASVRRHHMEMLDALGAPYENLASRRDVEEWLRGAGFEGERVQWGINGWTFTARKPKEAAT